MRRMLHAAPMFITRPPESVWDYPRPPRLEKTKARLRVVHGGEVVAETTRGYRVLETSHPPTYYIPPEDVRSELLRPSNRRTYCEWKGTARYFDVIVEGRETTAAAWTYDEPSGRFSPIRGYIAFYAEPMDACYVDDDRVEPQPGNFYGGWVTPEIRGPIKGGPGTLGW